LSESISILRQQLWRAYRALVPTLRRLQRDDPIVQGSCYLQRRRCGKPNCRCARGQLHEAWVLTRSEQGTHRLYMVPVTERGSLRKLTGEYRRYQRARAVLVQRHQRLLQLVDQLAEQRLRRWPPPQDHGPNSH
jgi:hypothetical protein